MHCRKFYGGSDSFITYAPVSLFASTDSEINLYSISSKKVMKRKVLAKQTNSFKIKFYKMLQ